MNIDILGISELKWTGTDEFNSDDHYIYYCGQESLRRNGVAIIVNKSPKCSTWMQSQKRQNNLYSFPKLEPVSPVIYEISPKYHISDSFVDDEGYSISSKDSCPQ